MSDRDKVIAGLNNIHAVACGLDVDQCYLNCISIKQLRALIDDATALLKAKAPRLMALEEVTARRGEPAYLEAKSPKSYSGYVLIYDVQTGMGITGVRIGVTRPGHVTIWPAQNLYGIKWRCWTARPTDAQREATPWEA